MSLTSMWGKTASFLNYGGDDTEMVSVREAPQHTALSMDEGKVVAMPMGVKYQIALLSPEQFDDCQVVADKLLSQSAVIVNLESMQETEARSLVDFLNGVVYAIKGTVERVSNHHFLYCPPSVQMVFDDEEDVFEPETTSRRRATAFGR